MRLNELLTKKCLFVGFNKQKSLIEGKLNATFVSWGKLDLSKASFYDVIFIGAVVKSRDKARELVKIANKNKIHLIMYGSLVEDNKIKQHKIFKSNDIDHPESISGDIKKISIAKITKLGFPVIAKTEEGEQGKGVAKLDNEKELANFISSNEGNYVFQQYLPNDGDYRLFFFNHKLLFTIKRSSQDKKEFRNNISLGGKQKFVKLPDNVIELASKIDKHFNYDFAGIDLIEHNGQWKILEINTSPQFIEKENIVIPEIIKYIKSL
jgi:glutathione synthase/RimK-type ligase-like ATP-grasp enzyme